MKRFFLFSFILILFFNSCEKEKESVFGDYQSNVLIRQIGDTENDMQIFTYYNTGKVFENLQRFAYRKFLYNDKDQLAKIEIAMSLNPLSCAIIPGTSFEEGDDPRKAKIGQYREYLYSDEGKLESIKSYFINDDVSQLMSYEEFEYFNDKVVKINVYNPQDQLTHYFLYLYDNNGNVMQQDYYYMYNSDPELQSRVLYEFDNKNNPFRIFSVEGVPGINTNKNNITRQTTTYYYNDEEQSDTIENKYEYNDLGYPVIVNDVEYIYGEEK